WRGTAGLDALGVRMDAVLHRPGNAGGEGNRRSRQHAAEPGHLEQVRLSDERHPDALRQRRIAGWRVRVRVVSMPMHTAATAAWRSIKTATCSIGIPEKKPGGGPPVPAPGGGPLGRGPPVSVSMPMFVSGAT